MKRHALKGVEGAAVLSRMPAKAVDFWRGLRSFVEFDPARSERIAVEVDSSTFVGMQMPLPPCWSVVRPLDSSCTVVVACADPDSESFGASERTVVWATNAVLIPPKCLFGFVPTDNQKDGLHRIVVSALDGKVFGEGLVTVSASDMVRRGLLGGFDPGGRQQVAVGPGGVVDDVPFTREALREAMEERIGRRNGDGEDAGTED